MLPYQYLLPYTCAPESKSLTPRHLWTNMNTDKVQIKITTLYACSHFRAPHIGHVIISDSLERIVFLISLVHNLLFELRTEVFLNILIFGIKCVPFLCHFFYFFHKVYFPFLHLKRAH